MSELIEVSIEIDAPALKLYEMISDVTRMGEWSPETKKCIWVKGANSAVPGARFKGVNQNGGKKWAIESVVVDADPGKHFSFDATAGPIKYARWGYRFEETNGTTKVTEYTEDKRGKVTTFAGGFISGVKDRKTHNKITMLKTLEALKDAAEADTQAAEQND